MAPGLRLALVVVAGTALGLAVGVRAANAVAVAVVLGSAAALLEPGHHGAGAAAGSLRRVLVLAAACALAVAYGARARERKLAPPLVTWFAGAAGGGERADAVAMVEGTIDADAEATDSGAHVEIDVDAVTDARGRTRLPGIIDLHVEGAAAAASVASWTAGRPIRAPVFLRRPDVWRDPGLPSVEWQTIRRRVDLVGSTKSAALVAVERGSRTDEAAAAVRAYVRRASRDLFPAGRAESAAIVSAILIGDRSGLDPDLVRRMQAAGTYHVIAISGGNVALVAALVLGVLRVAVRSFRRVSLATIAAIATYGWVVGGGPSVNRAVDAASIYMAAGLVGLAPPATNVLGVVALALTLIDPGIVVDVGAWLSFGATAGIILFAGVFLSACGGGARDRWPAWARTLAPILALFGATVAAELALLPVSATVFHRVGVAGLLLNYFAIPAMAVIQIAGGLGVLLLHVSRPAALLLAFIADLGVRALVWSSRLMDVWPSLSWRVPSPPLVVDACFYVSAATALFDAGWALRRRLAAVSVVVAAIVIATPPWTRLAAPRRGELRFTMFDVGQGDALLLQFPTGQSLVVDAGSAAGGFDLGDRIVVPGLWASGVTGLDWLGFTHADMDHIGGTVSVATMFRPREVFEGVPVPKDPKRRALRAVADREGAAWRELQSGDELDVGPVHLTVRSPPLPDWERQRVRNEDSVVLRVCYGDVELLLTGDIGEETEQTLLADDDRRALRILKVAHHGSRGSSSPAFVRAFAPALAFISVGRGNLFGHPAPEVVDRLRSAGATVFRTDEDGAIILETDGHEARVKTMTGRTWVGEVWASPI